MTVEFDNTADPAETHLTESGDVDASELEEFRQWQRRNASPEAVALTESGAEPAVPDVQAMLAQMRQLQDRVDSLSQAQGIPSDPIDALVMALRAHVQARADAHPSYDFTELVKALDDLPESGKIGRDDTELLKETWEDHVHKFAAIIHDFGPVAQFVRELHRAILKRTKG